jgi:hypothetical protein
MIEVIFHLLQGIQDAHDDAQSLLLKAGIAAEPSVMK